MIKSHEFEIFGGKLPKKSNNRWPDCLFVKIPRYYSYNLIRQLIHSLEHETDDYINLSFMGELKYNIPEEEPEDSNDNA